jgi:hypothetical protein
MAINKNIFPVAFRTLPRGVTFFSHAPQVEKLPPVVTLLSPAAGGKISKGSTIQVKVEDTVKLGTFALFVTLGDGSEEWIYNGSRFANHYTGSTKTIETELRHVFTLRRALGWPDGPLDLTAIAIDAAGNVAT